MERNKTTPPVFLQRQVPRFFPKGLLQPGIGKQYFQQPRPDRVRHEFPSMEGWQAKPDGVVPYKNTKTYFKDILQG